MLFGLELFDEDNSNRAGLKGKDMHRQTQTKLVNSTGNKTETRACILFTVIQYDWLYVSISE